MPKWAGTTSLCPAVLDVNGTCIETLGCTQGQNLQEVPAVNDSADSEDPDWQPSWEVRVSQAQHMLVEPI